MVNLYFVDCGSTVKRRAGIEGQEDSSSAIPNSSSQERTTEDQREGWGAPSPQPSVDSGQSGKYILVIVLL